MSDNEFRYGNNVQWFLYELSQIEPDDIDSDCFDVYGEDKNGVDGSACISITELAGDAYKIISSTSCAGDAYNQLCKLIGGNNPDLRIQEMAPDAHKLFMSLILD
jgi:hypothetical protein